MCQACLETFAEQFAAPENSGQSIIGWSFESMSDGDMLARLPLIAATSGQVDRYLREWVGEIRGRHLSYAEIGKALGVSRQAAWERFSRADDGPHPDTKTPTNSQDGTDPDANAAEAASL
jgi:hypothetical protein